MLCPRKAYARRKELRDNISVKGFLKKFIAVYSFVLAINFLWFVSGQSPLENESPLRIVIGSLFIFVMPGLVLGEIMNFRANHPLETIALSFALTITTEIVLLPIPFLFRSTIKLWIVMLFLVCIIGLFILYIEKIKKDKEATFLYNPVFFLRQPFPLNISTLFIIAILILISYGTYRWGESLTDISGEKILHMIYVRYYYSMPMALGDLNIYRGAVLPNLVHLWEYLVAAWATLINMDPLLLFFRSRFVITVLGFSGMYFLIRNIFVDTLKSEMVLWGVLIMCLGWFVLLSPSNLDWIKADPLRGVMSFMGTVHHTDSAGDILVALSLGLVLLNFRDPCWKNYFLLFGITMAGFMWHPRVFFQTVVSALIYGIAQLFMRHSDRKATFGKLAFAMSAFILVVAIIYPISISMNSMQNNVYDEFVLKKAALNYAFSAENIIGIRNLFNFPFHLVLSSIDEPEIIFSKEKLISVISNDWNYNLWLVLAVLAIPFLSIWGDRADKNTILFYMLLWFLVLSWNFSMLLFIFFTYSEFYLATPRFLYMFSYIIISASIIMLIKKLYSKMGNNKYIILLSACALIAGFIIQNLWDAGLFFNKTLTAVLSILVLVSFISLFRKDTDSRPVYTTRLFIPSLMCLMLFFYPIIGKDINENISKIISEKRPSIDWFGSNNPFEFSKELIDYIRTIHSKENFLAYPLGNALISVYAPQYMVAVPNAFVKTVIGARNIYKETADGKHPLFIQPDIFYGQQVTKGLIIPDFKGPFSKWDGPDLISTHELSKVAAPMILTGNVGEFNFKRVIGGKVDIIQVISHKGGTKGEFDIQFCYIPNQNGFNISINPMQKIIFVLSARLSERTKKATNIFIQDKTDEWERKYVPISNTLWQQYIVSKEIRPGAREIRLGVNWQPEKKNEYLEIRDVYVYSVKKSNLKQLAAKYIDHISVKNWLNKHAVDYLLIEKDYYYLLSYFRHYPTDYDIVFNNIDNSELIVRYLHK